MRFSERTHWDMQQTAWSAALEKLRTSSSPCFDLTASNPTTCGFEFDTAGILRELARPESLLYKPDPLGLLIARQAIARYYAEAASAQVSVDQILLTASTSEAYSFLFRLLCDPGSEVLIAQPSYPLFEFLADLDSVQLVTCPLFYDHGWHIDPAAIEASITPRTRALVIVNPNNPTGHFTPPHEREALEQICRRHELALIVDEVFLDYAHNPGATRSFAAGVHPVLTFVLSGLSKVAALPQMKVAWIAAFGPRGELSEAIARLEMIADTFLSVGAPVQYALPFLLQNRAAIQTQIQARVRGNLAALDECIARTPMLSRLNAEAGWYAVLRVPALESCEELSIRLMDRHGVIVHPGSFYGFSGEGWLVLSLLPPAPEFAEAIARIAAAIQSAEA